MVKTAKRLEELLRIYLNRLATQQETEELWAYVDDQAFAEEIMEQLSNAFETQSSFTELAAQRQQQILANIFEQADKVTGKPIRLWTKIAAAASVLLVLGVGFYAGSYFINQNAVTRNSVYTSDIVAGKNGATLTLSNGQKIRLADVAKGKLATESGVRIDKTTDGKLIYHLSTKKINRNSSDDAFNTLATARGEQYQVVLPDQSRVWLNSASSITFPVSFAGLKERKIRLVGEAYFEVIHNKKQPFRVQAGAQMVEDIGTAFNINAYADEPVVKTTLVEGSAKVNGVTLTTGQQSVFSTAMFSIRKVHPEDEIDWKNGYFQFNNENLESIMRKVCRWYNAEVRYTDESLKTNTYLGTVNRTAQVSQLLNMLERTGGLRFSINKNVITVSRNTAE